MRIKILGPLELTDDGGTLTIGGPRQQRVLACLLAAAPDFLTVDRLIDEVWGEDAPATAAHVISTYISNLRKALGSRIRSDGRRHRIDNSTDEVDAAQFAELLELGRSLLGTDPSRALTVLEEALSLWSGRPFAELADDSPLLQRRADQLAEMRLVAIECRQSVQLELGLHEQVIPELQTLTQEHPWREQLWQHYMLALYRSGRQAEALRVGIDLRDILVEELGIEPSPTTRNLEDRILLQDPTLELLPPTNLPAFASSFLGRAREVGEISKSVDTDRLVTLVGVGGVGKTRLAAEAGRVLIERFAHGVWWVDLASVAIEASVAMKVAEALDLTDQPVADPATLLARYLAKRQTLLILDNCEHVAESVAGLATTLLEAAPGLKILATSRRPLMAPGETRYQVPAMAVPLTDYGASDAERLFCERAARVDSGFTPTPDNAADIARICRDLDGLPLAIEMAAARANLLTPAQIAAHLDDRFRLLSTDGGAVHGRHTSLAAALDWSYDLLPPEHRWLFDRLSIFRDPFDLAACHSVAASEEKADGSTASALGALVNASMVTATRADGSMRYRLLDTLRIYGNDHLAAGGTGDVVAARHSRYFLSMAEDSGRARMTPGHAATVMALGRSDDDLLAALDWSLANDERPVTLAAAPGLAQYWFRRGDPAAALQYGRRMLEGAEHAAPHLQAAARACVGFGAQLSGDFELAMSAMGDTMRLLHQSDDWKTMVWALQAQGTSAMFADDPAGAARAGAAILDICSDNNVTLPRAYGLGLLGQAEFFGGGDLEGARKYLEEAVTLFRAMGDESALCISGLVLQAGVAGMQGDFAAAERHAVEATTLGGPGWEAAALIVLAIHALHPMGQLDRAERALLEGLTRTHERSIEFWTRTGLLMLGRISAERGQWKRAARLHGAARGRLPAWSRTLGFWDSEPGIRAALDDTEYEAIAASGEAADLDELVRWATEPADES